MLPVFFPDIILGITLTVCVFTDVLRRKIYNHVTLSAMAAGMAASIAISGWHGLLFSVGGLLLGGALLFIPFAINGLGAGDVKLGAAIGAIAGPVFALQTIIIAFVLGAITALLVLLYQGQLIETLRRWVQTFASLVYPGCRPLLEKNNKSSEIPFAPCIAGGALAAKWIDIHGFIF